MIDSTLCVIGCLSQLSRLASFFLYLLISWLKSSTYLVSSFVHSKSTKNGSLLPFFPLFYYILVWSLSFIMRIFVEKPITFWITFGIHEFFAYEFFIYLKFFWYDIDMSFFSFTYLRSVGFSWRLLFLCIYWFGILLLNLLLRVVSSYLERIWILRIWNCQFSEGLA